MNMFRVLHKRCLCRKRIFLTFFVAITISIWYIMYQAMSVHKLGEELSAEHVKRKEDNPFRYYQKADYVMQPVNAVENRSNVVKDHGIRIRGLLPKYIKNYIPNSRGNFICFRSAEEVSYNRVNNDYCDCDDGTDEPSTSACSNGRFYCEHQPRSKEIYIVSSRVNDGICDCCDGSDEWANVEVPPHAKISAFYEAKLGLDQTPCRNRC